MSEGAVFFVGQGRVSEVREGWIKSVSADVAVVF